MPPLIWIFIGLQLLHIPNFIRGVTQGVDPNVTIETGKPNTRHYTQTAPWGSEAAVDGGCDVQLFVVTARADILRLRIDGVEQLLDSHWTYAYTVAEEKSRDVQLEFIHPITREMEPRTISFVCQKQTLFRGIEAATL